MPPQPACRFLSMETGYSVFCVLFFPSNSCTPSRTSGRGGEKPEPRLIPSRIGSAHGDGTDALTPSLQEPPIQVLLCRMPSPLRLLQDLITSPHPAPIYKTPSVPNQLSRGACT